MKINVGSPRKESTSSYPERIVFVLGLLLMCAIIVISVSGDTSDPFANEAVLVMAGGNREEIMIPDDKSASVEEKWSIYDYIGEFFAELIFGGV